MLNWIQRFTVFKTNTVKLINPQVVLQTKIGFKEAKCAKLQVARLFNLSKDIV